MTERAPDSETKARALTTYAEYVSRPDVARGYLKVELENIFGGNVRSDSGDVGESLDKLSDQQINRLLEAISYTYRMNGTFHTVTDESLDWMDVELPIDTIQLTQIKPHINEIVYSPDIQRNPFAFAAFLGDYFAAHPDPLDDPQQLHEFRPRPSQVPTNIITSETNDTIEVFDGNHRLINAAMLGEVSIRAFAGIPNGRESITMKGDSVFLTLRLQFEASQSSVERLHILETCLLLAKTSTDGYEAIESYWVDHGAGDVAEEGRVMLARLDAR